LDPREYGLPEDGDRFKSPKRRVLIEIGTMDNVQRVVYSNNTQPSQTFRFKIKILVEKFEGGQNTRGT
jgi:hypothetical protein